MDKTEQKMFCTYLEGNIHTRYHARKIIEAQPTLAYSSVYMLKDCERYCLQQLQARHDVASDITLAISLQLSFICWYK